MFSDAYPYIRKGMIPIMLLTRNKTTPSSDDELFFPVRPFKGFGGVELPHLKGTENCESQVLPTPKKVVISMQQHVGAPCEPTVAVGDKVFVGQPIGDCSAYVSAPIHSSVSGTVKDITQILLTSGQKVKAVVIETDGEQTLWSGIKPPKVTTLEELCKAVRDSGLVGLGGAGFPAHVKLNVPKDKKIDTLVINGAECEPYLTADYREMVENAEDVLEGIYLLKALLKVERVIIGVEANKPKAIQILSDMAYNEERDPFNHVRVLKLKSQYPQGAEKTLVYSCTGRRIGKGKLPADVGCVVMNITSVAFIHRYLTTGIPLVSKRLTVDGSAVTEPKNVIAPIGTPISDIIRFCGGYKAEPRKLLMGGPMMGITMFDEDTAILKQNNGIIAFATDDVDESPETECIRCGRCVAACPMRLQPLTIENKVKNRDVDALNRFSVMSCMECGSCAFVCPAKRKLVQYMRMGKTIIRKAGEKK